MKSISRIRNRFLLAISAGLFLGLVLPIHATNLTGTFRYPDGSPVNGKLIFLLSQPARLSDASAQIVPRVKIFSVTDGVLELGAFVYGNDALVPTGTHYVVRLVDASNNLLFEQKWFIEGTDLNLNTLTPTTIGVALPDPLLRNVTGEQAVQGPVTFNAGLTTFSLTLNGNLHPGSPDSYDLGTPSSAWREFYVRDIHTRGPSPWFDVKSYGAVCDGVTDDTPALNAALAAAAANKGGVVYFPPCANGTAYYLQTAVVWPNTNRDYAIKVKVEGNLRLGASVVIGDPDGAEEENYVIEGGTQGDQSNTAFARFPCSVITVDAGVNPVIKINHSSGGGTEVWSAPITLRNLCIFRPGASDGIYIEELGAGDTIGDITIDQVWVGSLDATGTGKSLRAVGPGFGLRVRDSVFAGTTSAGSYSVEMQDFGIVKFEDIVLLSQGMNIIAAAQNPQITVNGAVYENARSDFIRLETSGGFYVQGVTLLDVFMADAVACADCAMVNYASGTDFFARDIYVRGGEITASSGTARVLKGGKVSSAFIQNVRGASFAENIASQAEGLIFIERDGRVYIGGTTSGAAAAVFGNRVGILTGQSSSSVPKAPLDISDGTGYGGTPPTDTRQLIQDNDSDVSLTFGTPDTSIQALRFRANPATTSGDIIFRHSTVAANATMEFYVNNNKWWDILPNGQLRSSVTTGTAPFIIGSTTLVANLNAGLLQGATWAAPSAIGSATPTTGKFTTIESTVATGTAPFAVASATEVADLNSSNWHGKTAIDFSGSLSFTSIAAQTCSELTIGSITGAAAGNALAPAWPV